MADPKKRITDLLRTAAPNSGASDNERQIAAVEAARLIAEHGFVVGTVAKEPELPWREPEPPPQWRTEPIVREYEPPRASRSRRTDYAPPPSYTSRRPPTLWQPVIVDKPTCLCTNCGRRLFVGEEVFFYNGSYRCLSIVCDR